MKKNFSDITIFRIIISSMIIGIALVLFKDYVFGFLCTTILPIAGKIFYGIISGIVDIEVVPHLLKIKIFNFEIYVYKYRVVCVIILRDDVT